MFLEILTLIFITLKLTAVIDWSWWFVLLPLYGPVIGGLIVALAVSVVCVGVIGLGILFYLLKDVALYYKNKNERF